MSRRASLAAALVLVMLAAIPGPGARGGALVDAAREYRASLDQLLPYQEEAVHRAIERLSRRREQLALGLVARRDVEEAERAYERAQERVEQTRKEMRQAAALVREAEVQEHLGALHGSGPIIFGSTFTVYRGTVAWSLREVGEVERFFSARFGRPLPVSALGQTPLHARLGLDHRNALDVAVHPDTDEGRALTSWLQSRGLPFIVFRAGVPGAATGAHVHVGAPSPRLASLVP